MSSKKYYWLKLVDNFFERDEIKIIEAQDNGYKYINFYLKLLLKSVKTDGVLMFRETIPYDEKMLSTITNTDIDTVRCATVIFEQLELMVKLDNGALFMQEVQNMTGSETSSAERVRRFRTKLVENQNDTNKALHCNGSVTNSNTEIEKETDIELEIETDIDADSNDVALSISKQIDVVIDKWNQTSFAKVIKMDSSSNRYKMLSARLKEYSVEQVLKAIDIANESDFLKGAGSTGWIMDFSWFVRPNKFPEVLEGKFNNRLKLVPATNSGYQAQPTGNKQVDLENKNKQVMEDYARKRGWV